MPRPKSKAKKAAEAAAAAAAPAPQAEQSEFSKADLFDESDGEVELKVNAEYAARMEHNKKRAELQRLESKYGKGSLNSDSEDEEDSEEDVTEDEDGEMVTKVVDEGIDSILAAIKKKDPRLYDTEKTWYADGDDDDNDSAGDEQESKKPKEKSMTLKEYHVQNLLAGGAGADEDQPREGPVGRSYQAEVDEARKAFLAAADGDDESDDDLLEKAERPVASSAGGKKAKAKLTEKDVEAADKDPEQFLKSYLASQAWVPEDDEAEKDSAWAMLESDDEEEEELAEKFEEAYNLRFEDPNKSNEVLMTHSRAMASLQSVRREEKLSKRQRARQKERERRAEAEKVQKDEKARLRKLKLEQAEKKVAEVKRTAGALGREFDLKKWAKFLEGDYDDGEWEKMMRKQFDDDYYAENDDGDGLAEDEADRGKPTWDDDIDIGDIDPSFVESAEAAVPADLLADGDEEEGEGEGEGETGGDDVDAMDVDEEEEEETKPAPKKSTKADKLARKATARKERRELEAIVDEQLATDQLFAAGAAGSAPRWLPSQRGLGAFKYRSTDRESFGLTPAEILAASDEQLNEFAGLKRYAPFRDEQKRKRDRKALSRARLGSWREDVFGRRSAEIEDELFQKVVAGQIGVGEVGRYREMLQNRERKRFRSKLDEGGREKTKRERKEKGKEKGDEEGKGKKEKQGDKNEKEDGTEKKEKEKKEKEKKEEKKEKKEKVKKEDKKEKKVKKEEGKGGR